MPPVITVEALIVVRTYPIPATPGIEVSCTAAITKEGRWLRLHPIPYRYLDEDKQFQKYHQLRLDVTKSSSDSRLESYVPNVDSIEILNAVSAADNWKARKDIVIPQVAHCLCCLKRQRDELGYPTLGLIRPKKIDRLRITPAVRTWTQAQLEMLRQGHLFRQQPKIELEKIPFNFYYKFHCDHENCPSHNLMCTDWEIGQAWRKWSKDYGDGWEAKFRQKFETEMIEKFDTHFFVGTIASHPNAWIIIGLFYPMKPPPMAPLPLFPE